MAFAMIANAQKPTCSDKTCCKAILCDTINAINMPVIIVDGVEVQSIDSIAYDDIVNFNVIKDSTITKIFSPRLGGVVVITTKSKKFLKPIIEEYNKRLEEGQKNRIPGELLIR